MAPAMAGMANKVLGTPEPVPSDGEAAVAPGGGGQVTFRVGMQIGSGPDGAGARECFGFGVLDGCGVATRTPHRAGKSRSPGIGAIGYCSLAGSALGSLMLPDEPHWPLTIRSSNVLAAVAHASGRPCSRTNFTRSRQPFDQESSAWGWVPSRNGTVTVRPQAGLGASPVHRQTEVMVTPFGCGKSVWGTIFLPFQSHGLLIARFMNSCQR